MVTKSICNCDDCPNLITQRGKARYCGASIFPMGKKIITECIPKFCPLPAPEDVTTKGPTTT